MHVTDPALRAGLEALQGSANGQDPLRYAFIVSQATLVDSPEAATAGAAYSATADLEEGTGSVTVGVARADGAKCGRCWNYSTHVGADAEHPELCERCAPVVREIGITPPAPQPLEPAAAAQ